MSSTTFEAELADAARRTTVFNTQGGKRNGGHVATTMARAVDAIVLAIVLERHHHYSPMPPRLFSATAAIALGRRRIALRCRRQSKVPSFRHQTHRPQALDPRRQSPDRRPQTSDTSPHTTDLKLTL